MAGRWPKGRAAGSAEPQTVAPCSLAPVEWRPEPSGTDASFVPASLGGYLQLVRSVFRKTRAGPDEPEPGGEQVLELALPSHRSSWTVLVMPVGRSPESDVVVGLKRRSLPAAQLGFGSPNLFTVLAWRTGVLPEAAGPLHVAAAISSGCNATALTSLGAPIPS